ncbi:WD40-repeat-containing domain protein [Baffinella frigidus]|nr:WD40-repeat-containing domain protein [Cryptophyta sp. CCMP2293]
MDIERILKATCDAHSLVAVQPQGEYWATTTENKVKLWCVDGGSCVLLRGHKGRILCVAFSPMGEMVCSGAADSTLRLWHTDGGECIATLSGHAGRVQCAAFDARGMNICSGSSDGSLRIWRTMDGRCSCVLKVVPEDSEASLTACAFRPAFPGATGAIACGASDGSLWAPEPVELKGHLKRVRLCIFHPAHPELLCTSSDDGTVKIWHSERGVCQQSLEGDLGESLEGDLDKVLSLAVLPTSGHLLIACIQNPLVDGASALAGGASYERASADRVRG